MAKFNDRQNAYPFTAYTSSGDAYYTSPVHLTRELRGSAEFQPYEFTRPGGPTGIERVKIYPAENGRNQVEIRSQNRASDPEQNPQYDWGKHSGPYVEVRRSAGGKGWERRDYGPMTAEDRYRGYPRAPRSVMPIPTDLVDTTSGRWRPESVPSWLAGIAPATPSSTSPSLPTSVNTASATAKGGATAGPYGGMVPFRYPSAVPGEVMHPPYGGMVPFRFPSAVPGREVPQPSESVAPEKNSSPPVSSGSSVDRSVARLDQLLRSDYPAVRGPSNSGFDPATFLSNVYAGGALAPEGTAARLRQALSETGESSSLSASDQAYRDALNTRFQGQNMDGTTFDRLPTDREAQDLAASSFRDSGRQVMPRITTNSTFPGQVNPNVGMPTVTDPYGGPNKYAWQGREASYGNRTYRSVTRDPRTGQTTIDNFSTPGNASAPQSRGLSPTVDPTTGATVEAPQVRAAQQAVMDQIRRRAELRSQGVETLVPQVNEDTGESKMVTKTNSLSESEIASAVPYNRNRQTWQNVANTMGIPTHRANASGRLDLIPEQERRAMMRQAARQESQNKYASDRAAWGNIIANRQAQNAGFANAYQAEMFRQIALANANRGHQPLINVQQGGPPQPAMNGAAAQPAQAPAQAARPLGVRGTNPGGLTDTHFSEVQQMKQNRSPQDVYRYMSDQGYGDTAINQVLSNLYPGENRSASKGGDTLPPGIEVGPDGREVYGGFMGGVRSVMPAWLMDQPTAPRARLSRPLRGVTIEIPTPASPAKSVWDIDVKR